MKVWPVFVVADNWSVMVSAKACMASGQTYAVRAVESKQALELALELDAVELLSSPFLA